MPKLSLRLPVAWGVQSEGVGMSLRTPAGVTLAVLSALGGVAAAAIVLPTSPRPSAAASAGPRPAPRPPRSGRDVRRTIHVVRRARPHSEPDGGERPGSRGSASVRTSDSGPPRGRRPGPRTATPAPAAAATTRVTAAAAIRRTATATTPAATAVDDDGGSGGRGRGRGGATMTDAGDGSVEKRPRAPRDTWSGRRRRADRRAARRAEAHQGREREPMPQAQAVHGDRRLARAVPRDHRAARAAAARRRRSRARSGRAARGRNARRAEGGRSAGA